MKKLLSHQGISWFQLLALLSISGATESWLSSEAEMHSALSYGQGLLMRSRRDTDKQLKNMVAVVGSDLSIPCTTADKRNVWIAYGKNSSERLMTASLNLESKKCCWNVSKTERDQGRNLTIRKVKPDDAGYFACRFAPKTSEIGTKRNISMQTAQLLVFYDKLQCQNLMAASSDNIQAECSVEYATVGIKPKIHWEYLSSKETATLINNGITHIISLHGNSYKIVSKVDLLRSDVRGNLLCRLYFNSTDMPSTPSFGNEGTYTAATVAPTYTETCRPEDKSPDEITSAGVNISLTALAVIISVTVLVLAIIIIGVVCVFRRKQSKYAKLSIINRNNPRHQGSQKFKEGPYDLHPDYQGLNDCSDLNSMPLEPPYNYIDTNGMEPPVMESETAVKSLAPDREENAYESSDLVLASPEPPPRGPKYLDVLPSEPSDSSNEDPGCPGDISRDLDEEKNSKDGEPDAESDTNLRDDGYMTPNLYQ